MQSLSVRIPRVTKTFRLCCWEQSSENISANFLIQYLTKGKSTQANPGIVLGVYSEAVSLYFAPILIAQASAVGDRNTIDLGLTQ